ncbi:Bug family tripartite tricarboxylate transporter substrate binding protein [Polaromonas glacialis]|uniref:Bug family tripartite tricarboxylate transporter substrate binding protein n=1 Tax=Polaromonas glacialis TaxID=866564 RepID=UPI00068C7F61|nr:tripartite tricarboxylate transporter substrate binding protein [Polaromonas glacialis]
MQASKTSLAAPFRRNALARGASLLLGITLASNVLAQTTDAKWPARPIRLVTPFSAGGPGDDTARLIAHGLSKALGQSVVVDNKPGAGSIIGADAVAKAAPDGYTLLAAANGTLINSLIRNKMPYAAADLVPVTGVSSSPSLLVIDPQIKATNLKELQAFAKSDKNGLFFATTGIGSTSHFSGEMLKASMGVPLTFVQYKSGGESSLALLARQVQLLSEVPSVGMVALAKSGKVRALAVASDRRLPQLPEVPTTAEAGFPEIRMTHWLGLMAPKGTPPEVLDRINSAVQNFISSREVRETMAASNSEPMLGDRAQFTRFIDIENKRLGKIATDLKILAQ